MIRKTWNEFWGELLLVRFHQDSPERWDSAQRKARWIRDYLHCSPATAILDLGCGDGLMDICLARVGADVTAVDRLQSVLEHAIREAGSHCVHFMQADLRELSFPAGSFDRIIFFETAGLMSTGDDQTLISNSRIWLRSGGMMAIDCPYAPVKQTQGADNWDVTDGHLSISWTYDADRRLQRITPILRTPSGETITLHDPYDPSRGDRPGVIRYLYPMSELKSMMKTGGFSVKEVPHYAGGDHYLLLGSVRDDA